jgi:HEAT repeat protein
VLALGVAGLVHASGEAPSDLLAPSNEKQDAGAVRVLAERLYDNDAAMRMTAFEELQKELQKLENAAALDALIAALKSDHPNLRSDVALRERVAMAIGGARRPDVVAPLMDALRDRQAEVRAAAAFCLGHQSLDSPTTARLVELLIALLRDSSSRVRGMAADVLGRLAYQGDTTYRDRIIVRLRIALHGNSDDDVRRSAITALGLWKAHEAVESLVPLLEEDELRSAAAGALGQIGDPRAIEPLRRYLDRKESGVIRALGELRDRESVVALIGLLGDRNDSVKRAAAEALGAIKDRRAVDALIGMLKQREGQLVGDEQLIRSAARALGEIQDPRAVGPLIDACRNPMWQFRMNRWPAGGVSVDHNPAAWPLFHMGLAAVEPLAELLEDESQDVREVAASVLYNLHGQGGLDDEDFQPVVESLAAALDDASPTVRYHVAMTLGRLKDPRAKDVLFEMLSQNVADEQSHVIYTNAFNSIGALRDEDSFDRLVAMLGDKRPGVRGGAARAIGLMRNQRAVEHLLPMLDDAVASVRTEAAQSLGILKAAAAVDPLVELLGDPNSEVRTIAARSLSRIGESRAADALAGVTDHEDFELRTAAGLALVTLGDERGPAVFAGCLADADARRREQAATAVAIYDFYYPPNKRILPTLAAALDDPSIRVRLYAALAVGRIGGDAAIDALLSRLSDSENIGSILQGLAATKNKRALAAIAEHVNHADERIRCVSIGEIGQSGDVEYAAVIVRHLSDPSPDVRLAAIKALTSLNAAIAFPQLKAAQSDDDPRVAFYAARALKRISR